MWYLLAPRYGTESRAFRGSACFSSFQRDNSNIYEAVVLSVRNCASVNLRKGVSLNACI